MFRLPSDSESLFSRCNMTAPPRVSLSKPYAEPYGLQPLLIPAQEAASSRRMTQQFPVLHLNRARIYTAKVWCLRIQRWIASLCIVVQSRHEERSISRTRA